MAGNDSTQKAKVAFAPTSTKLTIGSTDDTSLTVKAQYNPKELQVDRNVPWSKPTATNKNNATGKSKTPAPKGKSGKDGGIRMEFTGAEGRSVTVELLFDAYESVGPDTTAKTPADILKAISDLETMATVRDPSPSAPEDKRRPHQCVVSWGDRGLPKFNCVIQSLSIKYQVFSLEGAPLRASVTVKLAEADSVSLGKAT